MNKPEKPPAERQVSKSKNRRSDRYLVVVPVKVKWAEPNGAGVIEFAEAREVNEHGGLIQMKGCPAVGSILELTNTISTKTATARVVSLRLPKKGVMGGVAVELVSPSEAFWGVTFRLKVAIDDLLKLEQIIRAGGLDARVLRDFRDAVDYVRKTAWAVQEFQERQAEHRDTATVRSLLTAERVRRTTELSNALATDLESREVTDETVGVTDLFRAIEDLDHRLGALLKGRNSRR
ncbi:MAG TPA: hypothetical protein VOA64_17060 [Candidatus Dormibacteraeota bacterium]|nr:hypothetical protein [Candidatus Dormibacteraeota bacterium]